MSDPIRIGIITISDRASAGVYEDLSGPAIVEWLRWALTGDYQLVTRLIPDERDRIAATITELVDLEGCCLVVTTGGTGPAARDVTPEATRMVIDRELPGFGEAMRMASLKFVPTAILSRQLAGTRGCSLIVNLPGKPKAIAECLQVVMPAIPYCIDLLGGPYLTTDPERVAAFRPKA